MVRSKSKGTRLVQILAIVVVLLIVAAGAVYTFSGSHEGGMYATFWSLVPPIIAIMLALITKEVYSSLFIGILVGALFQGAFHLEGAFNAILNDCLIGSLTDSWNVGILVFLVALGILVQLINRSGGSSAYGRWAGARIRNRRGALGATFGMGLLIFVDDYFNCMTVGNVMRPVTDKFRISREKLAYIIDSTAAPVCMIAPISSWAAAVSGVVEGTNGITLFIQAIPYNFYSLMTILMVAFIIVADFDFGPMLSLERNAKENGVLDTDAQDTAKQDIGHAGGKVIDLVLPVVLLIVCCILGMLYNGGAFEGVSIIDAFANCVASVGLSLGAMIALIITIVYYLLRGTLSFKESMECVPEGFKAMVPAILILTFAWGLKATTGMLGADEYVSTIVKGGATGFSAMLPAIIFLIAVGLSFATGTSWGTFGILIPIVVGVLPNAGSMLVLSISACLAGAVCGDHCSPISDTTIMASAGAACDHVKHVSTQLPYAMLVAGVSFVGYVIAGVLSMLSVNLIIALPITTVLMLAVLIVLKLLAKRKAA